MRFVVAAAGASRPSRRAGCSQRTVPASSAATSRARCSDGATNPCCVDASVAIEVRWRGAAIDRLLDEDSRLVVGGGEFFAHRLVSRLEVTYSEFGERGSIDILAYHAGARVLLTVEVKTELAAVEATLRKIDEKVRLAASVSRDRFGWEVRNPSRLLVMPAVKSPTTSRPSRGLFGGCFRYVASLFADGSCNRPGACPDFGSCQIAPLDCYVSGRSATASEWPNLSRQAVA